LERLKVSSDFFKIGIGPAGWISLTVLLWRSEPLAQKCKNGVNRSRQQQRVWHPSFHNFGNSGQTSQEKHNNYGNDAFGARLPGFGPHRVAAPGFLARANLPPRESRWIDHKRSVDSSILCRGSSRCKWRTTPADRTVRTPSGRISNHGLRIFCRDSAILAWNPACVNPRETYQKVPSSETGRNSCRR